MRRERTSRYLILRRRSIEALRDDLKAYTRTGWRIHGRIFQAGKFVCQPIVSVAEYEIGRAVRLKQTNADIVSHPLIDQVQSEVQRMLESRWDLNGEAFVMNNAICQPVVFNAEVSADLEFS